MSEDPDMGHPVVFALLLCAQTTEVTRRTGPESRFLLRGGKSGATVAGTSWRQRSCGAGFSLSLATPFRSSHGRQPFCQKPARKGSSPMNGVIRRSASSLAHNRSGWISFVMIAAMFATATSVHAQYLSTRHVRDAVRTGTAEATGRLSSSQVLSLNIVLPLRDEAALKTFLEDLYNPSSSGYRHFLTVAEFTSRFGPNKEDYDAVVAFANNQWADGDGRIARRHGCAGEGLGLGDRDGLPREHAAPTSIPPRIASSTGRIASRRRTLPFSLWHVSGLDNYSIPHPMLVKKSDYAAEHGIDREMRSRVRPPAPARRRRSWAATCARPTTAERR